MAPRPALNPEQVVNGLSASRRARRERSSAWEAGFNFAGGSWRRLLRTSEDALMRVKTLIALVVAFFVIWRAAIDRDVIVAQGRKPVVITRIFTGADGLAHAEDVELSLNARGVSEMLKATGAEFSVRAPT